MIPLSSPANDPHRPEIWHAVQNVLSTGRYVLGPETETLERTFCDLTGATYAVAVSSCSDALYICYKWWSGSVAVPALTFAATAESAVRAGRGVSFYDIGQEPAYSVTVPLFGVPTSHTGWLADKAQCFPEPLTADAECYSFFPAKPLGTTGDGGMIVTHSAKLYNYARALRNHGSPDRITHQHVGGNMRISEINAAVLNVKLSHLDYYKQRLANTDWLRARLPIVGNTYANVVSATPIVSSEFETKRYYTRVVPHHPAYSQGGSWPVSEWFAERLWGVPCGPELGQRELDIIARGVEKCMI